MKKFILLILLSLSSLVANDFDKKIQGKWYYKFSVPMEKDVKMVVSGYANYMFNHKVNHMLDITFVIRSEEINAFMINGMGKWTIKDDILLEEVIESNFITNSLLKHASEFKTLEPMLKQMYYKGMIDTSKIKSITDEKLILESEGMQVIANRKPHRVITLNNYNN